MIKVKERGKWLIALALCLSCLLLCASLISAPTLAEPDPTPPPAAAATPKTVALHTLWVDWKNDADSKITGDWKGPATHKDVKGVTHENSLLVTLEANSVWDEEGISVGVIGWAQATLPVLGKKYTKLTGTIIPAEGFPNDCNMSASLFLEDDSGPNESLWWDDAEKALDGFGGVKKGDAFRKDSNAAYFTLDLTDVGLLEILVGKHGTSVESAGLIFTDLVLTLAEETTPPTPTYGKYKAVDGYQKLYEVLDAQGNSKQPNKEYILSDTVPTDGSAPPAKSQKVYAKNESFYAEIVIGSGIFLAVKADGSADFSKVIWWGDDRQFGTQDDFDTSVKEEGGYFFWKQRDGLWKIIEGILDPDKTTTVPETGASGTQPSGSTTGADSSNTTDWLGGSNPNLVKTGKEASFNTGTAVCMALLFIGCAYCGYQAFRRRAAKRR